MFINEIKIMHRRNLGNYEHREATLGMTLTEEDNVEEAVSLIKTKLKGILYPERAVEAAPVKEETPKEETPAEPVKKKVTKKKVTKKAPAKKKEPEVVPTMEEMMALCRETANRLKSGEKVKALIEQACGVGSLKEADEKTFLALKKLLEGAK